MSAYQSCVTCSGQGYFSCNDCRCLNCEGKGKIKCSMCQSGKVGCPSCRSGRVPCASCDATGLKIRKGWVFTHQAPCPDCRGTKSVSCHKCKGVGNLVCSLCDGAGVLTCASCDGRGRLASCERCNGTKKVICKDCGGKGKVESEWTKSLRELPVDRLRFEIEKRQREISNLQIQVSRLSREEDEAYDDYVNGRSYGMDYTLRVARDKVHRQSEIEGLESEIEAIEQVINLKWK